MAAPDDVRAELRSGLALGLRLAAFRAPGELLPRWSLIAMLAALGLAVPVAADLLRIGPGGDFDPRGLPGALFHLPLLAFCAWALAALAGRPERTPALLLAQLALLLPLELVDQGVAALLGDGPRHGWRLWLAWLPLLWLTLAASVAALRLLDLARERRLAAAGIVVGGFTLPLATIDVERSLWRPHWDAAAAAEWQQRRGALASEAAFYRQPQLLDAALAALAPGRPGVVDLYFVGAAGDSAQDVFMNEIRSVARMFEQRFDTAGRSVLLINNPKTSGEAPVASVTSLERTLRRIGERMNRDEDILFLFLTSHGSEDHRFQLDFWPLQLDALDPPRLRRLLDEAGIRHRVIVVSACYSGGFIEALRNADSLVIAAAAPDRTSFGCSHEADFTFFGKAYFDEALRRTDSFVEAFELARPAIAERERREDFEPSDPRIDVGANIGKTLEALARSRRGTPRP